jgi:hypothetical protein
VIILPRLCEKPPDYFYVRGLTGRQTTPQYCQEENTVERGEDIKQLHDSELGDIYDLYNACNGATVASGLLDVRKLDELSPEESKVLNLTRLREVWEHTASGCLTCAGIVRRLNFIRKALRESTDEPCQKQVPAPQAERVESY